MSVSRRAGMFVPGLAALLVSVQALAVQLPGPLVDADWLMENLDGVLVLDVRKDLDSFEQEGHIRGAVPVSAIAMRAEREVNGRMLTRMLPDRAAYITFMQDHGVSTDSVVVITHPGERAGQVTGAARLYWQMKVYGFERVAMLDGGNRAWVAALGDLETDTVEVKPGRLAVAGENPAILAGLEDVRRALDDETITLIDTRDLRFHVGLDKRDYVNAYGHIPGSHLLPYDLLHPTRGSTEFQPVDKLMAALESMRIEPDRELILYCNSGYDTSSVWFALKELLGHERVKIYDGSLHEWTQYAELPMTRKITAIDAAVEEPAKLTLNEAR